MKVALGIAFLSLSICAMAGCASTEPRGEAAPQARTLTTEELYIARVEQIARRRGIEVVWVHLPKFDGRTPKTLAQE